jgi:hypothetical protein
VIAWIAAGWPLDGTTASLEPHAELVHHPSRRVVFDVPDPDDPVKPARANPNRSAIRAASVA